MAFQKPDNQPVKQAYQRTRYTREQLGELQKAARDPIYFMEKFMKVRHPTRGMVDFILFDYQKDLVKAYNSGNHVVCLFSRQMGKCTFHATIIKKNDRELPIWSLIRPYFGIREYLVTWLEGLIVRLALKT